MKAGIATLERSSVLVIDDEPIVCNSIVSFLKRDGYLVEGYTDPHLALQRIAGSPFDIAIVDYNLPGILGDQLIRDMRKLRPTTIFVAITGAGSEDVAIRMWEVGIEEYFEKPILDFGRFRRRLQELSEKAQANAGLRGGLNEEALHEHPAFADLVGRSPAMVRLKRDILDYAAYDVAVLIQGESGSGKNCVAKAVHLASPRAKGPLEVHNLAALAPQLVESKLFGHEKGAFSGAVAQRLGMFECADTGTVVLDEVGEFPLELQAKLLQVIHDRIFYRLGGIEALKTTARVIAATHVNLEIAVRERKFRQDLLYRINDATIHIPPLRERKEDIPLLAWHFVRAANQLFGKRVGSIDPAAMDLLLDHDWEANNVRELEKVITRCLIKLSNEQERLDEDTVRRVLFPEDGTPALANGALTPADALPHAQRPAPAPAGAVTGGFDPGWLDRPWKEARVEAEAWFREKYLRTCLRDNNNNVTHAARQAGVDRSNFHRMMRQADIHLMQKQTLSVQRRKRGDDPQD